MEEALQSSEKRLCNLEIGFKSLPYPTSPNNYEKNDRAQFIDKFISLCEPYDLMYLSMRIDETKRDFIWMLPTEVVEIILSYLDWTTLLKCCQVEPLYSLYKG